jgi:hypothetical protein
MASSWGCPPNSTHAMASPFPPQVIHVSLSPFRCSDFSTPASLASFPPTFLREFAAPWAPSTALGMLARDTRAKDD